MTFRSALSCRVALALASLCAPVAALLLTATPAFAERTYESQITGFQNPWGVTIDSDDNVWVSDPGNGGAISEYDAYPSQTKISEQTGGGHYGPTYIRSLGVDSSNGYLYVADSGPEVIDVFNPASFVEQWSVGGGYDYVAVDNSGGPSNGRVYVAKASGGVLAFSRSHEPLDFECTSCSYISGNTITGTPSGPISRGWNITVDNEGNIYVVDQSKKVVDEFKSSGEFVREFTGAGASKAFSGELTGVAVDPTNGNVMVVDSGNDVVDEFSSSGEYLDQIMGTSPSTPFGSLNGGIAINSSGYVYVADGAKGVVDIFTPYVVLPKVTYKAISNQTQTSGTLNASINPNEGGNVESCRFEYGETNSYGHSVQCLDASEGEVGTPVNPIESTTEVHANISGLTTEKTYHYRVVAVNANGTKNAPDQTFTPHAVAGLCTEPATSVERNSATLRGCLTGNGEETKYYFEWGTTDTYGNKTAVQDAGSPTTGEGPKSFSLNLKGLQVESEYHYRFVAENAVGTTFGQDQSFTTQPAFIGVATEPATNLTATSATLNGSLEGNGEEADYYFEWGSTPAYGNVTPAHPASLGSATGHTIIPPIEITDLEQATTYYYRVVATNPAGTTRGQGQSLETLTLPKITPSPANEYSIAKSDTDTTEVTVHARIDPVNGGEVTSCMIEYGPEEGVYTSGSLSCEPGQFSAASEVSAKLTNLLIGTTYHFRFIATTIAGTTLEADQTVTTLPLLPAVASTSVAGVTERGATLSAMINPGDGLTAYRFQFGLTASYGEQTPPEEILGAENSDHSVGTEVTGLEPGTTYHFRVIATNFAGTKVGPDHTFTTSDVPKVGEAAASEISPTGANLTAEVDPELSPTTYHFEYGTTQAYGLSTDESASIGTDAVDHGASAQILSLMPDTTYHFRIVATNAVGVTNGFDQTFTTVAAPEEEKKAMPPPIKCHKGFVKKHGMCIRRTNPYHHKKHGHRGGKK